MFYFINFFFFSFTIEDYFKEKTFNGAEFLRLASY